MPSVIKSAALPITGRWAPKNSLAVALTGGAGASHLLVAMYVGQGGTGLGWGVPNFKYNGVLMTRIGTANAANDIGGAQTLFVVAAPAASGDITLDTTTDFYVNDFIMSYTFIGEATGVGTVKEQFSAKDAPHITSVLAAAGSMVLNHSFGVYMPSLVLTGGTPTPTTALYNTTAKADLPTLISVQTMTAAGTATATLTPPYNHVNSLSVEFTGGAPTPQPQTITTSGSAKPVAFGQASVVRMGPQEIRPNGSAKPVAFGQASVGSANMNEPLQLIQSGVRFTTTRTSVATYLDATEKLVAVAANAPRMGYQKGALLGVMNEPAATNFINDNMANAAVVGGAYPAGGGWYNGGLAGATCTVVGKGVEDGINYVDLQFVIPNTTGAEVYPSYTMGDPLLNAAASGSTWTLSAFMRIVAGDHVRATDFYPMVSLGMNRVDATGGYISTVPGSQGILQSDTLHRHTMSAVMPAGNKIAPLLALAVPAGRSANFTVRLGLPQLELGAYPSSPIRSSGAAAVTRTVEQVNAKFDPGTYAITVERTDHQGIRTLQTYTAQTVPASGLWPVPAVASGLYVRRVSTGALTSRAKAKTTAAAKGWMFGSAFSLDDYNNDATYGTLIRAEAGSYGAEYELKPDQVQRFGEGVFDWTIADAFVAKSVADGVPMRGHALVWYAATPTWMQSAFTGATTARWQKLVDDHIAATITRWPNLHGWDVVNEVLEPFDGLPGGFRNWSLYGAAGSAYIDYAFRRARFHAPTMDLFICEYGLEENDQTAINRRVAMLNLLTRLVNEGVPVTGLSIQCHLDLERPFSRSAFNAFLTSVRALGLKVIMTELDVRAPADDTAIQYDMRAAYRVREVLDVLLANTTGNQMEVWNLRDQYTWLDELGNGRTQRPTPFISTANTPKAMYAALQEAFEVGPNAVNAAVLPQDVSPAGTRFATTFGLAKIGQSVRPAGSLKAVAFGPATVVSGAATISPTGFKPVFRFGQATSSRGTAPIKPSGIAVAVAFGAAKLNLTIDYDLEAVFPITFGGAKLGQNVKLGGSLKPVTFGTAKLGQVVRATGSLKPVTFGTAKLGQNVRPAGAAKPVSFGAASVLRQNRVLPAGIAAPVAFGTVQLLRASQIGVNGFRATVGFGTATMRPVAVLRPAGLAATTRWGVPSLGQSIRLPGLLRSVSFGAVTVARAAILNPPGFTAPVAFGKASLPQQVRLGGTSVATAFGSATLRKTQLVLPVGKPVPVAFGSPVVLPEQIVRPQPVVAPIAFGVPALRQSVRPAGLPAATRWGVPSLPQMLRPTGKGHGVQFGTASALQNVGLAPVVVPVLFGSPAIRSGVAPASIQIGVSFGAPTLKQQVRVTGHEARVEFGTASMPQAGLVYPPGIEIEISFGQSEVRPEAVLRPAGLLVPTAFGQPVVLQNQPIRVSGFAVGFKAGDIKFLQRVLPDEHVAPVSFGTALLRPTLGLSPLGFRAAVAFGAADIAQGANIRPEGINAQARFGPVTVLGQGRIATTGKRYPVLFGKAVVLPEQIVSPAGFRTALRFGDATLGQTVTATGFRPLVAFGAPTVLRQQIVRPVGLPAVTHFGQPVVLRDGRIVTDGLRLPLNFGPASVSPVQSVSPAGLLVPVRFGESQVANGLLVYPESFDVPVAFGSATVEVETDLFVGSIEIGITFGAGRVAVAGQDYAFVKLGDEWAAILEVQVRVDGEWKEVESVSGKVDGAWEIAL